MMQLWAKLCIKISHIQLNDKSRTTKYFQTRQIKNTQTYLLEGNSTFSNFSLQSDKYKLKTNST